MLNACQLDARQVDNLPSSVPDFFSLGEADTEVEIMIYANLSETELARYTSRSGASVEFADEARTQIEYFEIKLGQFTAILYPRVNFTQVELDLYRNAPDTLIIYTALSTEQLERYLPAFAQTQSDIKIVLVRDSTGNIGSKLSQEVSSPIADVVWGTAVNVLLRLDALGVLDEYEPAGLDRVAPNLRDELDPPHWVGIDVFVGALCVNTEKIAQLGLPMPFSWRDLTNPVYRDPQTGEGYLLMPNPEQSGTGYMLVSSFFELFGSEEAGWDYMSQLHENIQAYTSSGSAPCRLAAEGEIPVGLSFASEAVEQHRDRGLPVLAIFPDEGVGYAIEANALMKKPIVKEISRTFLNWAISDAAMQEYSRFYPVTSVPAPNPPPLPDNYPPNIQNLMIPDMRASWYTANYERITTKWLRLFSEQSDLSK